MSLLRKAFITKGVVQVQEAEMNMPGEKVSRVVVEECKAVSAGCETHQGGQGRIRYPKEAVVVQSLCFIQVLLYFFFLKKKADYSTWIADTKNHERT